VVEDDSPEAKQLMPDCPIAYLAPCNVDPALLRHAFGPTPRCVASWVNGGKEAPDTPKAGVVWCGGGTTYIGKGGRLFCHGTGGG
jgi:hypothetical protein